MNDTVRHLIGQQLGYRSADPLADLLNAYTAPATTTAGATFRTALLTKLGLDPTGTYSLSSHGATGTLAALFTALDAWLTDFVATDRDPVFSTMPTGALANSYERHRFPTDAELRAWFAAWTP